MKKQIKKILLSLSILASVSSNMLWTNASMDMPTSVQGPQQMPMPSVQDIFGGMSEDEIIQQVQEAQKFFDSLSPEEIKELKQMVAQTMETMTPQDLKDIQGIANMVEPHLDLSDKRHDVDKPEKTGQKDSIDKKTKADATEISSITTMITAIVKHVDEIVLKAEGNKATSEEVKNWDSRITFQSMIKQIIMLKESRFTKKLLAKSNKEEEELAKALEEFSKNLEKCNKSLKIEDSFGLPASRDLEKKQIKDIKEILSMFEKNIDKIMPLLEKFFRKYDPEALEMAKEAEQRAKKATAHETDAARNRPSGMTAPPQASGMGLGPSPYGRPSGYGPGPSSYNNQYDNYSSYPQQSPMRKDTPTQQGSIPKDSSQGKSDSNKKSPNNPQKPKNESLSDIVSILEDHKSTFGASHENQFDHFLQKEMGEYPDASGKNFSGNPVLEKSWLESTGAYPQEGFTHYEKTISKSISKFADELDELKDAFDNILQSIPKLSNEDAAKLHSNHTLKSLGKRIERYADTYKKAITNIDTKFTNNTKDQNIIDPNNPAAPPKIVKAPMQDTTNIDNYKVQHNKFKSDIHKKIEKPLEDLQKDFEKILKKAKAQQKKRISKSSFAGQVAQGELQ